ncbi:MAG: hypothetical protein ACRENA_14450 [Vulcanimicrobiaceae bacterium]
MMRRFLLSLFVLVGVLGLPAAAGQDVVTLSNGKHLVIERPDAATVSCVVLLIPGGTTKLRLGPNGETSSTNFVIRTRQQLLDAGYAVAYMDDPADLREPVQRLRAIGHPVAFLATSRGTIVATANALRLGSDGPDLLILTSPVTQGGDSIEQSRLKQLKIPTLVVANDNDRCRVSPPRAAARLADSIGSSATFAHFSSTAELSDACEPLAPHGYYGIEQAVITAILDWIKKSG